MKFRIKVIKNSVGTFYEPQIKIWFLWKSFYLQGGFEPAHGGDKKRTDDLKMAENAIQEYKERHEINNITYKYL